MITQELKSHFMSLYKMILADDLVKPEELLQLYLIGKRHGISENEFNEMLISPIEFAMPDTLENKIAHLCDLVDIILADGIIDDTEVATLKRYCVRLGFVPENVDQIVSFLIEKKKARVSTEDIIKEITE